MQNPRSRDPRWPDACGTTAMSIPVEHNLHGQDYQNRAHLRYQNGGLIDVHAHMHLMKGKKETEFFQAELLVNVALEFWGEMSLVHVSFRPHRATQRAIRRPADIQWVH